VNRNRNHSGFCRGIWVACLISAATACYGEAASSIHVYPENISLTTKRDFQSIVVQAVYPDRTTRDVTSLATIACAKPDVASIDGRFIRPASDGETILSVSFEEHRQEVQVSVQRAGEDRPASFRLDVMPVFMKAGCNTGSCHGSARGQDRFRLSLFGFDPDGDYYRITREQIGRRINLAIPADSMLVQKPNGAVPHTGSERFKPDSEFCGTILEWLESGAPKDNPDIEKPVGLTLMPSQLVLTAEGAAHQLTARAAYSDGSDRDVTSLSVFLSNNEICAAVSPEGLITPKRRGEAFILARFSEFSVVTQVIVVPDDPSFVFPEIASNNYIDELVQEKWKKLRITPSELCTDEQFLRRVYIDLVGLLPDRETYTTFLADTSETKRAELVDKLLTRKEFVELWVMYWAEQLQMRSGNDFNYKPMLLYYNWLKEKISTDVPFDQMVRELLASSGGTFRSPATNYYRETDTLKTAENVAQVFMGIRTQCAQCHNHPFDRWTMDDYYGFAAFFPQIGRKNSEDPRERIVFDNGSGEVKHPVTNQDVRPKFLGGETPDLSGRARRMAMADWLTSPENEFFARNLANRLWAHFFGVGIVEPVDDVRVSNPPSNPELLDQLTARLIEYKYDTKKLVRDICLSRAYQLATKTNETNAQDNRNFSHATIRRIRSEVLLDCVTQVTETRNKFAGLPLGARAVQIADGTVSTYFLSTFGRAKRDTPCSCEVVAEPSLSQALHLLNGSVVHEKIPEGKVVPGLMEKSLPPESIIEDLYIRCFTRKPTDEETSQLLAQIETPESQSEVLQDLFWALLNAKEFTFNH
jgi:hypothetical protein